MRKALSLVEVLVAIILITIVIGTMLEIKSNNIFFLEKFKNTSLYNSYISLAIQEDNKEDKNIYLDEVASFNDDEIRKKLKQIKIEIKLEDDEEMNLPDNDYVKTAKIIKTTYTVENQASKVFYRFELQY
ncbi:MAG: type II secretion system protein [Campylobacteraceae bacterium]|jgi:type II secretory pathway pseudopilin PulG|nr:type II secretion system protein [Campylobacteraceae bacterium]MBT3881937.1 type II secretion system protein [Campylobacteraceae bacterium]MBT5324425.1 type II secretion system protein [Campylobacteraceae bacterium]MBT6108091.1 type II secretion system protein [Campylobacteraceae bacterium]MBT6389383.1 type II secretion system protein [Campylobacteraceae bacterium]